MSNKKLLEETTIRKFMKLANIDKPLRENFVSALDERGGREGDLEAKRGNKGGKKTRGRIKHQQDEAGMPGAEDPEYQMDEFDMGLGEDEMGLGEDDMGLDELEIGGEAGAELDISEEDAMSFIRVAKALEQALGVEAEAELEDEEADLEGEEEELEGEEEELEGEEEELEAELEPEEGEEEEIEIEEEPEEGEDIEVEEEEEVELQEALVKKVAARVAKRLLKKR